MAGTTAVPSVTFHQKSFGQHIQLQDNTFRATRHTSFDNGITFTSKQIKPNERIHMKIMDIDESGQWLGSLAIGFTQIDPNTIRREELCKSALPNLCTKTGTSYMKRIFERLRRENIISFYYNQNGAFYILDGREQELCKKVDVNQPLWGVIDIYGNVKSVCFTTPPKVIDGSRELFNKYDQKPDKLPIRYFPRLKSAEIQPVDFHEAHGPELELFCQNKVAFRRNVQKLSRPYLFIDLPMTPGDELYIRILSIDHNYRTAGVLGFTNADASVFTKSFNSLPSDDPMGLYDRPEFWILNDDAFDEKLSELDEYRFVYDKSGEIQMWRNTESATPTRTVAHADPSQTFHPFFFLNGRITALSLIGLVSLTKRPSAQTNKKEAKDEDSGLCQVCYDAQANCVLTPCGHVFFCSDCRTTFEEKSAKRCPVCRKDYTNVIEIADD